MFLLNTKINDWRIAFYHAIECSDLLLEQTSGRPFPSKDIPPYFLRKQDVMFLSAGCEENQNTNGTKRFVRCTYSL